MSQANNRVIQVGGLDEYHSLSLKKVEADKGGDWGHCKTGLFCEMQTGSLARRGTTRSPSLPSETLRHYGNRVFEFPVHNKPRNAPFVQAPHKCDDDCNGGYSTKTGMSRPAGCCASWASVERPRLAPSEIKTFSQETSLEFTGKKKYNTTRLHTPKIEKRRPKTSATITPIPSES
nr:unnamed protein product [Spirometra erinaceieuropaei]